MILQAKEIYKRYQNLEILKGVSLVVQKNEVVSIVGASGAGKSTLLHILGTLDTADKGDLFIADTEIKQLNPKKLAHFRNQKIGFVFQFHNLLPEFTALENVCMPAFLARKNKSETEQKAKELLKHLNVFERQDHKPAELSGGEQQRVAVARSMINEPSIIFADEPSGNLDTQNADSLHELFFELREKTGQAFVIVTHNTTLADMADRKVRIAEGKISTES